ncbi:M23 family metallopeptidase [Psychrobacter alimentarius]|uniref:M23 family metallopeptidase n=1 Tax=Psychrobacter alimentarius TaxID=261164 RepID=UPI003FD153C7
MQPNNNSQPPRPTLISRVLSVLIKAVVLLALLFVFDRLLPTISQQTQSFVMAKWQQLSLLQQDPPAENSLPNPLPEQGLADTWGAARSQGRTHEGIDIFAPRGTPIQSTTQGIVSKVGNNNLGGRVVVVVGPGGAGHYYAHLEDYADISPNDWVNAGDIIGYVGDSGNAKGTPPHLHYGIYINGSAVNPYPLLQKE